jgi:2-polyprenyl-3-methyl-5-hydroxy-6-metoxy-1,4-benzoquinol methylase
MRIKNDKLELAYNSTKAFFARRAHKFNVNNPYSVTMFQDNDPELVRQRNQYEVVKLGKLLQIDPSCTVLDMACGIGRWADFFSGKVKRYLGIDFSEELIRLARSRTVDPSISFQVGSVTEIDALLDSEQQFNRVLLVGILMYLNDDDVASTMAQLEHHCEPGTLICIREPIGTSYRLTLKDFYSSELEDTYNAVYRTRDELVGLMTPTLLDKGFSIAEEGCLFEDTALNNRVETVQYYFILKRQP